MNRRFLSIALKWALVPAVVAVMLLAGSFGEKQQQAEARPAGVVALNESHCVTLGVAFGGIAGATAVFGCTGMMDQQEFQRYNACLQKLKDENGAPWCGSAPVPPARPQASDFAGIDLDANKVHIGQYYEIIAFVDDDFPVRFTTDRGHFVTTLATDAGQELLCEPGSTDYPGGTLDEDCDGDNLTVGDGVVVGRFVMEPGDGTDGVVNINVVQENIGWPVQLTVTGPPDEITMEPLFGKGTIQTGATPGTASCLFGLISGGIPFECEQADPTDCNAELSVDGVLGAGGKPEQTIIVTKALDSEGEEVSGALIGWYVVDQDGENVHDGRFYIPGVTTDVDLTNDLPTGGYFEQGGVQQGLQLTPTLDTGALGIAFPQFVCGGKKTGELTFEVKFDPGLIDVSPFADKGERERITLNVISGPEEIQLAADPPTIDCDGTSTSKVTATILNSEGDPVANGVDVNFSVVALGTANPLKTDSAAGAASTVVTPLSGAGDAVADGQPKGVTVNVEVIGDDDEPLAASILVGCSGGPPPPGTGSSAGAGGAPATGSIRPPDTGTGGLAGEGLAWWPFVVIGAAGAALAVAGTVSRRLE